jgi:hypothetical protein
MEFAPGALDRQRHALSPVTQAAFAFRRERLRLVRLALGAEGGIIPTLGKGLLRARVGRGGWLGDRCSTPKKEERPCESCFVSAQRRW